MKKLTSWCFLIFFISNAIWADINNVRTINKKLLDTLDGIPYREMLYNEEFQTRFSLPDRGKTALDNGLLAIAFEVSASTTGSRLLSCGLHLYVDTQRVKLILNNSLQGVNPNSSKIQNNFFTHRYPLNNADVKFKTTSENDFNSRLLIKSDAYPRGITSMERILSYTINLYSGISHFEFNPPCDALDVNNAGASHIWLNKTSNPQNLPEGNRTGNSLLLYKFTVPIALSKSFSSIINRLNIMNKNNRREFSLYMRKHREILNAEKGFSIPNN